MSDKRNNETEFKTAYDALNAAQKDAVYSIEGPVMVVAGPGTGKTQVLTLRIANILLQTDTPPDGILALTFTESGAKAMRERLRRYVGSSAYQVPIFTFHGFAQMLIASYPDAYQRVIGGRLVTDIEKISIIESIINSQDIKLLRPVGNPVYYVPHIIRIIGQLKQEYVTPEVLNKLITDEEKTLAEVEQYHTKGAHKGKQRGEYTKLEKSVNKNKELAFIYRAYEAALADGKLYDYEDMIVETVKALESDTEMLRDLQERYLYVLADEHQDVNGSQNKILELLASFHDSPNIFAVGDEKQAIYRFQGASLENFLYFKEKFKGTKIITLTENYRSGQIILDAAHSLVAVDEGPLKDLRLPLQAKAVESSHVTSRTFSHQAVEDDWLVEAVKEEIKKGTPAEEIAIIVRTNREVESLAAALRKQGVEAAASADSDILSHPITEAVRNLIAATWLERNEEALFKLLHGAYWGISQSDLVKILAARSYSTQLVQIITDDSKLEELGVENPESVKLVSEVLEEARKKAVQEPPHRVLEYLLQASGFLDHVMTEDPLEGTRVIRRLYDEIEEMVMRDNVATLAQVSEVLKTRQEYNLPLNAPFIASDDEAVQVMTAHKSKGLEFAVVFMPHLTDKAWGGSTKRTYFAIKLNLHEGVGEHEYIEDERRLFYVAMTRAKHSLHISSADTNADGQELIPSRLIYDLDENYLETADTTEAEQNFNPAQAIKSVSQSGVSSELLKKVLAERGFSATSLNNYLSNPWDYFYRNILRIPEIQPAHMQYGTAVHNTLEYLTRHYTKEGKLPPDSTIKNRLETELGKLPLNTNEFTNLLQTGLEEVLVYKDHLASTLRHKTKEEFSLKVVMETGLEEFPEITLTGKLDRLDLDENGYAIRVTDYKTGKPKTRNVIEGKTKSSDGGYKRQLVFYALLLELYDDERYKCREGVLSFVQPDTHGQIKEEAFTITDEEIAELKDSIVNSIAEIISGQFLETDHSESEYSQLAQRFKAEKKSS